MQSINAGYEADMHGRLSQIRHAYRRGGSVITVIYQLHHIDATYPSPKVRSVCSYFRQYHILSLVGVRNFKSASCAILGAENGSEVNTAGIILMKLKIILHFSPTVSYIFLTYFGSFYPI
jgi:hypothetical protein